MEKQLSLFKPEYRVGQRWRSNCGGEALLIVLVKGDNVVVEYPNGRWFVWEIESDGYAHCGTPSLDYPIKE